MFPSFPSFSLVRPTSFFPAFLFDAIILIPPPPLSLTVTTSVGAALWASDLETHQAPPTSIGGSKSAARSWEGKGKGQDQEVEVELSVDGGKERKGKKEL